MKVLAAVVATVLVGLGWYGYHEYRKFSKSAREDAIEKLVAAVDREHDDGVRALTNPPSVDQVRDELAGDPDVVAVRTTADGAVQWDMVLNAVGSDRSSWTYSAYHVRTCVRFTGHPGVHPRVARVAIDCPAVPPSKERPYDETVILPNRDG